jgi:hypothetical protein
MNNVKNKKYNKIKNVQRTCEYRYSGYLCMNNFRWLQWINIFGENNIMIFNMSEPICQLFLLKCSTFKTR